MTLTKTRYTDEEIHQMLEALFLEKKHAQELQQKLKEVSSIHTPTTEREILTKQLTESKLHSSHLEKGMKYLQAKIEELNTDNTTLFEEKNEIERELSITLRKYEQICKEKEEIEEELKAIQDQFEQLKQMVISSKENVQLAEKKLQEAASIQENHLKRFSEEIESLKEMIVVGMQQVKEFERRSLADVQEKSALELQCRNMQQVIDRQVSEKQRQDHHFSILQQEKEKLHEQSLSLKKQIEEQSFEVKLAQQHLAKKVRETTLLSERFDDQASQLKEFQYQLNQYITKNAQLESLLESYRQDKTLQEKLDEKIKTTESEARLWEQKFREQSDYCKRLELSNQELKEMEKRYHQMQLALSNLGNVLNPTIKKADTHKQNESSASQTQTLF
jgi:chromosome segregation ATPase